MKINIFTTILTLSSAAFLTGCYEDKGNYTYSEIEEMTCEFPTTISAMQGADYIEFDPVVTSSINGVINGDNPDYSFSCKLLYSWKDEKDVSHPWTDVDPDGTKNVKFFASYPANNYTLWYTIKNNKTEVSFDFKATCSVISTTSAGWMVLSNVGAERRVYMDVIFPDPKGGEKVAKNVFMDGCIPLYNGYNIALNPSQYSEGDRIYVCSESGSYRMDVNTLQFNANDNIKNFDFSTNQPGEVVNWMGPYYGGVRSYTRMVVTTEGNAYSVITNNAGAGFEFPLNTDEALKDPTYKVSRMMGTSQVRPGNSTVVLLYDITNKRFVGYNRNNYGDNLRVLFVPKEDENSSFSFTTGMDIVDMESTLFSDGEVFTVLQDNAGKRHVYGIYVNGWSNAFNQDKVYECDAPDFHTATDYAFHSQYPFMFYCKDNKVYCYNMGTNTVADVLTLPSDEKVSLVKFNMFQYFNLSMMIGYNNNPEFQATPYRLIVGSDKGAQDTGAVRFYEIDPQGKMTLYKEFSGFSGEIADVVYHERR